jgi:hypothetical protein
MSKSSRSIERDLAALAALRGMGSGAIAPEVEKHLSSRVNLVVAKAADLAREAGIKSFGPRLVEAFGRFMGSGAAGDKGCAAKRAIANALYELGCDGADVQGIFLAGIRHVQMEAAWGAPGGSVDTAAELRGICALGLVRMGYREIMTELVDLLMDPSHQARILAARAIAYGGRDEGALLLRMKILAGDVDENVTCECLLALGKVAGAKAIGFLRKYLEDSRRPALAESAAMALGEMRNREALAVLMEQWAGSAFEADRRALLLPIALSRLGESVDFLLSAMGRESEGLAGAAIEALGIYRHDSAVSERVRSVVEGRGSAALKERMKKAFGSAADA